MALLVERVALGGVDTLSEDPEGKSSANLRKKKITYLFFLYKKRFYTLQYFFFSKEINNFWFSFFYLCMK